MTDLLYRKTGAARQALPIRRLGVEYCWRRTAPTPRVRNSNIGGIQAMTFPSSVPAPPPRRRFPGWLIALIAAGSVFALVLCAIIVIGVLTLLGQKVTPTTITSDDSISQVAVPGTWQKLSNLNDVADLQAGYPRQEQYLIVITESKADMVDTDLEAYTKIILQKLTKNVKSPQVSAPRNLTISGRSAIQYEVRGIVKNLNVVYWLTSVDGAQNFHQVLAWTLASKAEANQPILQGVIESFHEVGQ
jgi:hypothetical protein